jgi:predicted metal-dependent phosphoesterase TrpH
MPAGQPFTRLCEKLARPRTLGRADLHIHSTSSDGTYTPAQVVELARRSGLSAIAITDHDTTAGLTPAQAAADNAPSPEVIAGVEITTEYAGRELHLLGYFFRADDAALQEALQSLQSDRVGRFHEMIARLRQLGIHLPDELLADIGKNGSLGRRNLAELLVQTGAAETVREAFQRYLHDRGRAAVPKRRLPVADAIALVRGAGGVAAWAHPTYDCTEAALTELRDLGLQALEVDFPSCRPSRSRELRSWAVRFGMAVTGGSDCHGPEPAGRGIGTHGISASEIAALRQLVSRDAESAERSAR